MIQFLKLIRVQNLLFIAVIQLIMQHVVIVPILQRFGFAIPETNLNLLLLIVSTVLIAAGGYVLNDYFDVKIDSINKPSKLIVTKVFTKQIAMLMHQVLTALGVLAGLYLAFLNRSFSLAFIFIVVPGLLWFYSASYKRQFVIGNLIVSFLAALSVLVVAITQIAVLQHKYDSLIFETPIPAAIYAWVGGFALFSFLTTWVRELIKDIEDVPGDKEMECRTMPIVWGTAKTKIFLYILILFTIFVLLMADYSFIDFQNNITLKYIVFGIIFPFLALIYLIFTGKSASDFNQAALLVKFIMLVGVLYGFVFYFLMAQAYGLSIFDLLKVQ